MLMILSIPAITGVGWLWYRMKEKEDVADARETKAWEKDKEDEKDGEARRTL